MLVTACGGGDSGDNVFQIVGVLPGEDSEHIALQTAVEVRFNRDIDDKSLSKNTFRVVRDATNEKINGTFEYSPETLTVKFIPAEELQPDEFYQVRVSHKVTDKSGNHLTATKEWEFETTGKNAVPIAFDPADQETDVSVKASIHLQFDKDINGSTVTADSFYVHDKNGNRVTGEITVQSSDILFKPTTELLLSETYTANLTPAVKDTHAQSVVQNILQWRFTTASTRSSTTLIGGSEDDAIRDSAVDKQGNIYIVGSASSKIGDQTPTPGGPSGDFGGRTPYDIMVAKYNAQGQQEWIRLFGTPQYDEGLYIVLSEDATGNVNAIYVAGTTEGNIDTRFAGGDSDLFLARLSPVGTVEWKTQNVAKGHDLAGGLLRAKNSDAVYLIGSSDTEMDTAISPPQGPGPAPAPMPLFPMPTHQIFLLQYDAAGNLVSQTKNASDFDDIANEAVLGNDNRLYLTGLRHDLNALRDGAIPTTNGDALVGIFDATSLAFISAFTVGTDSYDEGHGLALDNLGNIYIAGTTSGLLGNSGKNLSEDAFLAKYDTQGTKIWIKQWGTDDPDQAMSPIVDAQGNVLVLSRSLVFDTQFLPIPTPNPFFKLGSRLFHDNFHGPKSTISIYKYAAFGDLVWPEPRRIRSSNHADGSRLLQDIAGNLIVTGVTHGAIGGNVPLGDGDGFLVKFDANGATN